MNEKFFFGIVTFGRILCRKRKYSAGAGQEFVNVQPTDKRRKQEDHTEETTDVVKNEDHTEEIAGTCSATEVYSYLKKKSTEDGLREWI